MQTKPNRSTAPTGSVVSLDEVKRVLAISWDDDNALLQEYIDGAVDHLEGPKGELGRFLLTQMWTFAVSGFPTGVLRLPFVDVQSVALTYFDEANIQQTLEPANYSLVDDPIGSIIVFYRDFMAPPLADIPFPITVTMTVGYGSAEEVPIAIKTAVKMIVARWFENRPAVSDGMQDIPNGVDRLISNHRVVRV